MAQLEAKAKALEVNKIARVHCSILWLIITSLLGVQDLEFKIYMKTLNLNLKCNLNVIIKKLKYYLTKRIKN